jgi:hypothetical protein
MKLSFLTYIVLELNALIDTGRYQGISIAEIHRAIEQKRALEFVKEKCGEDADMSMPLSTPDSLALYNEHLLSIFGGYAGNERRKWGVERSGLCLLLAWTNEIIQQGSGWEPPSV